MYFLHLKKHVMFSLQSRLAIVHWDVHCENKTKHGNTFSGLDERIYS
jgi:hypothetical protein